MSNPYGGEPPRQDPAPWGQPVEYSAQQGWGQTDYPMGYPSAPTPSPPPKPKTGVIVAVVLGLVAVLAVVGVGLVVITARDKDQPQASNVTATVVPATSAPGTSTPRTTTTTPRPGQPSSGKLTYTDFAGDWNFTFDNVELHADWVEGRDHANCRDFEVNGTLTGLGCQYAAEMVYRAEGGGLKITQFVLAMPTEGQATAALGKFTDADLHLRPGTYIDNFATGKWRDGTEKEFVVVTVATANAAVAADTVKKYLQYRHADTLGALAFR
ncbi:hypothetical protein ACIBG0_15760 [Nocardia sp. NPDC050630]|uniref:hypothetical protein n=1 Tax=Nocardia sp. NPDC050630 TaxID=3364321 RepID=UPI00378BC79D